MLDEYEVLNYVYKNASMGATSTKTLLKSLEGKDNKIKSWSNQVDYDDFEKMKGILATRRGTKEI